MSSGGIAPGDVMLELGGQRYPLRLSFSAALAIEADCNTGLVDVAVNRIRSASAGDVATVLAHLLRAGGTPFTRDEAGALLMQDYQGVLAAVSQCLAIALTGNADVATAMGSGAGPREGQRRGHKAEQEPTSVSAREAPKKQAAG